MAFKLFLPVFLYALLQCQAMNVTKMVYVISGLTYYSSNLTGELSYELLSLETTDIPTKQKNEMYKLGQKLRLKYGQELENVYNSQVYTMHTSESPVSMMTGLLINAGIWPPKKNQIWNEELLWQPVPYEYETMDQDEVLAGTLCPSFELAVENSSNISHSNETDKIFHNVSKQIQSEYPKLIIRNHIDLLKLYYVLRSKDINGENLSAGVRKIYGNATFVSLALQALKDLSKTPLQKQLNGGTFLKKVLNDFDDYIAENHTATQVDITKVMTVYSGDEINIAGILAGLEVKLSKISDIPLALIFELIYDTKLKSYNIVIKSQDKDLDNKEPKVLNVHGCKANNCTFEHFKKTIAELIPKNEVELCGRKITPGWEPIAPDSNKHNFASNTTFSFLLLCVTIIITTFVIFK